MLRIESLDDYQKACRENVLYKTGGIGGLVYATLGLNGEAGEVAEKVKKLLRDKEEKITPEYRQEIVKELGDVFWYLSNVAYELGVTLSDVANINIEKLRSRAKRNQIKGEGDNR